MKKILIFDFILLLLLTINSCEIQKQTKPNIIWFVIEDQSQYFLPFYGDNSINLPNINLLTKNGVVFSNMNSPYPVCAPSRSAIITGMYPNTIGTGNQRAYSYYREKREKSEFSLDFPFYSSKLAENIIPFTQILRENGYYTTNNDKEDYNFKLRSKAWDESKFGADWQNRKNRQPFFSVFNFGITHESSIWERDKDELFVNPDKLNVPEIFPNDSITRHALAVNYSNLILADKEIGKIINKLKNQNLFKNSYIFFFSDHGGPFPRHKRSIYETGSKVPLIVKFPEKIKPDTHKQNEMLNFIDLAPTILSISNIDIPEIYQGYAFLGSRKVERNREYLFTSSDRFDEVFDMKRAIKNKKFKYIRNYYVDQPHAIDNTYRKQMNLMNHLIQLNEANLLNESQSIWFKVPKKREEFYDLENDPFELKNLISNASYSNEIKVMREELDRWMEKINDLGMIPEKNLIDIVTN